MVVSTTLLKQPVLPKINSAINKKRLLMEMIKQQSVDCFCYFSIVCLLFCCYWVLFKYFHQSDQPYCLCVCSFVFFALTWVALDLLVIAVIFVVVAIIFVIVVVIVVIVVYILVLVVVIVVLVPCAEPAELHDLHSNSFC